MDISADIRNFIFENIDSVETIETLLLLRENASRSWNADQVSQELRSDAASVQRRLRHLFERDLLEKTKDTQDALMIEYRFRPRNDQLRSCVEQLSELYRERRYSVIQLIFSKPRSALKVFSEAFRIRKEGD